MKPAKLGDILVEMGAVDAMQLQVALAHQRQWGTPLGKAIVDHNFCSPDVVLKALSKQTRMPTVDLDQEQLDPKLAHLLSRKVAEQHRMIPLRVRGAREEELVVAIAAPATLASLDAARAVSRKHRVVGVLASDTAIARAVHRLYGGHLAVAASPVRAMRDTTGEAEVPPASPTVHARTGNVYLYGWPEQGAQHLVSLLQSHGIAAKVVGALLVKESSGRDVLIAPIPALEALWRAGKAPRARVIAAGKNPEFDLPRAHRLGARSFLLAPLDTDLLLRAIRRCRDLDAPAILEASVA